MATSDLLNKLRTDITDTYTSINNLGGTIPEHKNTENIAPAIESVYNKLPKVSDTGTDLSLSPTLEARLGLIPRGNTYQQTYSGKNLYDITTADYTSNCTLSNNVYTTGALAVGNRNVLFGYAGIDRYTINAGETFYISADIRLVNGTCDKINAFRLDKSGFTDTMILNPVISNSYQKYACQCVNTTDAEIMARRILLQPSNANLSNAVLDIKNVMISKSSDFSYEPYTGGQPSPNPSYPSMPKVVTGENGVKVENRNLYNDNGTTTNYYVNASGEYVQATNDDIYIETLIENNIASNYTVSFSNKRGTSYVRFAFFNGNTFISRELVSTTDTTINTPTGTTKIIITTDKSSAKYFSDLQIQKGTTANPYVEHKEQNYPLSLGNIELVEIGDYADYIEGTPNNWVKKEEIGKVVLDGSENWSYVWQETDRYGYRADIENALSPTSSSQVLEIISNYYKVYSQSTLSHTSASADFTKYGICIRLNNSQIIIKNNDLTSVSDLKEWLSTHNTIIWYPLAEPTDVPITDTTLINQLNALYYARSYDDETNISTSCEDGNMPMKFSASALKGI